MIPLSRRLALRFRAMLRRSTPIGGPRLREASIVLTASADGLMIGADAGGVLVSYHQPGSFPPETLAGPLTAFADCEANNDDPAEVHQLGHDRVEVRWRDRGVPRSAEYQTERADSPTPELPEKWTEADTGLLTALHRAVGCIDRSPVRYSLDRIQLQGRGGAIVASDGHQLLRQKGFRFPWTEDLLVACSAVFGCRELVEQTDIAIGRTEKHVMVRAGPWTVGLPIDKEGRFPSVDEVLPKSTAGSTLWRIDSQDAEFLRRALPGLPGKETQYTPLTVDLNGHAAVRARAPGGRGTELVLTRSHRAGPQVRISVDRRFVTRALDLGFSEFRFASVLRPVVCEGERLTYAFMPLGEGNIVAPDPDDLKAESSGGAVDIKPQPEPEPEERKSVMNHVPHEEPVNETATKPAGFAELLEEAQALQELFRDGLARTTRLVAALKQHRRQAKAVQTTLASLRQLQAVGA